MSITLNDLSPNQDEYRTMVKKLKSFYKKGYSEKQVET